MNLGKACAIFKQLEKDEYTDAEKIEAIRDVLDMETHNSITKLDFMCALAWLWNFTYHKVFNGVESLRETPEWIPIKMRPGTDEEYEEFSQYGDCPREDFRIFDSPMPDDDQEVLVTTRWGEVCKDIWHRDVDCCYFEDNSDDDDVVAWMPLPEPYKKGGAE